MTRCLAVLLALTCLGIAAVAMAGTGVVKVSYEGVTDGQSTLYRAAEISRSVKTYRESSNFTFTWLEDGIVSREIVRIEAIKDGPAIYERRQTDHDEITEFLRRGDLMYERTAAEQDWQLTVAPQSPGVSETWDAEEFARGQPAGTVTVYSRQIIVPVDLQVAVENSAGRPTIHISGTGSFKFQNVQGLMTKLSEKIAAKYGPPLNHSEDNFNEVPLPDSITTTLDVWIDIETEEIIRCDQAISYFDGEILLSSRHASYGFNSVNGPVEVPGL